MPTTPTTAPQPAKGITPLEGLPDLHVGVAKDAEEALEYPEELEVVYL